MTTIINFNKKPVDLNEPLPSLPRELHNLFVTKHLRSVHHSLGAIIDVMKEHVLHLFPKGYFKHVYIGTTLSSVAERRAKGDLNQFRKLSPALAISPTYAPQESLFGNEPIYTFLEWTSGKPPIDNWEPYVDKLFHHETSGRGMFFNSARMRLNMEVAIKVGTEIKAWDLVSLLRRKMRPGYYFYQNMQLIPVELPNLLMLTMAQEMEVDLSVPAEAKLMLDTLNRFGRYQFTMGMNPATGNQCFFFKYPANLLFKVEGDYSYDKGMIGKVQEKTIITNTISCEFTIPDTFAMHTFDPIDEDLIDRLQVNVTELRYLNVDLTVKPPAHLGNLTLQFQTKFMVDTSDKEVVDVSGEFPSVFRFFAQEEIKAGRSNNMKVIMWDKHGQVTDFSINWDTGVVTTGNLYAGQVYHLGFYFELSKVREFTSVTNQFMQFGKITPEVTSVDELMK